jgi:hypothetical protein
LKPDPQVVELQGRHRLIEELLGSGVEIAMPVRDRGIDLVAYLDTGDDVTAFKAWPIQVKAATGRAFSLNRKYAKFPDLLFALIWDLGTREPAQFFLLSYTDMLRIGTELGWTDTTSWKDGGVYSTSAPSAQLLALLAAFKVEPGTWRQMLVQRAT